MKVMILPSEFGLDYAQVVIPPANFSENQAWDEATKIIKTAREIDPAAPRFDVMRHLFQAAGFTVPERIPGPVWF